MELGGLYKLSDKTRQDLMNCEAKIQNWVKFKSDYKALEERLLTITDKTRHEVMVPIGGSSLAFMPGFIKHTNEILVLLGDNYFVERSAKQAIDIVNRRLRNCDKMIDQLNEEKSQLQNWLSFSEQFASDKNEDLVEIVEEYNEEKEKLWREEHRRKVRAHKLKLAEERKLSQMSQDLEISQILENLEIQENQTQEKDLKSILKKDKNKSEEVVKTEKSVSFDESEESVISNEMESYPLSKFDKQMTDSKSSVIQSERDEAAFKTEVTERVIDEKTAQTVSKTDETPRVVSRFKANRLKK